MNFTKEEYIEIGAKAATKLVEDGLTSIIDKGKGAYKKILVSSEVAFQKYYETAIRKYSSLKSIVNRMEVYYLYDIYVNLYIEKANGVIDTSSIKNILKTSDATIITGIGGSGKSTLLKHLFLNSLELNAYIPFFIELRDLNGIEVTDRLEFALYKILNNMNLKIDYEHFCYALEKCDTILFLDGFDELEDEKALQVAKGIKDLFDRYEKAKILVTSRPCEQQFISWNNFNEFRVCPLKKQEAIELIRKINYSDEIKNRFLNDLEKKLFNLHKSFASNPLLLTIMLLTYGDYSEIPSKIHMFYEEAFEVLFRKHDSVKGMAIRNLKTNLPKDDFEKILSAFSFISYLDTKYSFRRKELTGYLEQASELTSMKFNIDNYIIDLQEVVCIIQLEGLLYSFTHRSFQEYFTALFILRANKEQRRIIFSKMPARSISKDSIISLLYDMNRDIVETELILPALKKIKKKTKYGLVSKEESSLNFLKSYTSSIMIMEEPEKKRGKKDLSFAYGVPSNNDASFFIEVMFFINRMRDKSVIMTSKMSDEFRADVKRQKLVKFINKDFTIDEFFENKELTELYEKYGMWRENYYNAMELIEILEKEYHDKKDTLIGALKVAKKKRIFLIE